MLVPRCIIVWLANKYLNLDNLNKAWATQRWSKRINQFEEVGLPVTSAKNGVPEKILDFRRFVSDEVNQFLFKVIDKVNTNASNVLTNTMETPLQYGIKKMEKKSLLIYSST
nr:beta-galactosidase [uncultured Bacteroides sp.]